MKVSGLGVCVAFCVALAVPQCRAASLCNALGGNLVTNCGFETGTFSGWSLSGNDVPLQLNNLYGVEGVDPIDATGPHSGSYQAYLSDLNANATTLSQTFSTVANSSYTISFYLAQDTLATAQYSNEFLVSFGGVLLASMTAIPVEGYTKYSYTTTATSASSSLNLTAGDGLGEILLDDVSVVQTPEPPSWTFVLVAALGSALFYKSGFKGEGLRQTRDC